MGKESMAINVIDSLIVIYELVKQGFSFEGIDPSHHKMVINLAGGMTSGKQANKALNGEPFWIDKEAKDGLPSVRQYLPACNRETFETVLSLGDIQNRYGFNLVQSFMSARNKVNHFYLVRERKLKYSERKEKTVEITER